MNAGGNQSFQFLSTNVFGDAALKRRDVPHALLILAHIELT